MRRIWKYRFFETNEMRTIGEDLKNVLTERRYGYIVNL